MIQRIQSVYLAVIAVAALLLFFLPVFSLIPGEAASDTASYSFSILSVKMTTLQGLSRDFMVLYPLIIVNSLVLMLSIAAIFMFKSRPNQIKICQALSLIVLVLIVLMAFDTAQLRTTLGPGNQLHFSVVAILPLIQLVLCRLAGRAIKKDEQLVRSADRLR
ncbi:hypothetical protein BH11BAC2_BH11BAC2_06860 [soil metagenome]